MSANKSSYAISIEATKYLAAFYVYISHFKNILLVPFHSIENPSLVEYIFYGFLSRGDLAVAYFFILSGYLVTSSLDFKIGFNLYSAKTFMIRRFVRIYPVYLLSLIITFLFEITIAGKGETLYSSYFYSIFFLNIDRNVNVKFNGSLWSLPHEIVMYLTILVLVFVMIFLKNNFKRLCVSLFVLAVIFYIYVWDLGLFYMPFMFIVGASFALLKVLNRGKIFALPLIYIVALFLFGVCVMGVYSLIIPFLLFVAVLRVKDLEDRKSIRVRISSPANLVIQSSYSLYCLHYPIIISLAHLFYRSRLNESFVLLFVCTLLVLFISIVSFVYVERFFILKGKAALLSFKNSNLT